MSIPPLFPFYGSKWRDARRYPPPRGNGIVEPFAGSAGYSLWHEPPRALLVDVDPIIIGVWDYLIGASEREILRLPDLASGQSLDDFPLPQEARWLIGFWLNRGSAQPKKRRTKFSERTDRSQLVWGSRARERIAANLEGIRDWETRLGSYDEVPARSDHTYFIDPPYVEKGRYYRYHDVDYDDIASWAQSLAGQVIVCEQEGATWLPFEPLASIKSTRGRSSEVVWVQGRGLVA